MEDKCQNCEKLLELQARVAQLEALVKELQAALASSSKNSHRPPSSDPPGTIHPGGSNTRRGRKGHTGHWRQFFPPERVTEFIVSRPATCRCCGHVLPSTGICDSRMRQQIELPKIEPIIREVHCLTIECPHCHARTSGNVPAEYGTSLLGPRLTAFLGHLRPRFHLSVRKSRELLKMLIGEAANVSTATIARAEQVVNRAMFLPYQEVKAVVRSSEIAWTDETGWRCGNRRAWLWVARSPNATLFRIDPRRSGNALKALLGSFSGIVTSDRWTAYSTIPEDRRQLCFSHLKRDFQKLIDRGMGAESLGVWGQLEIKRSLELWHRYRQGLIKFQKFEFSMRVVRARFKRLLRKGMMLKDPKAVALCKNIRRNLKSLWTFVIHPDLVEPTNNRAERALRAPVIWRKVSQGSKTERGITFAQRLASVVSTLKQHGQNVMGFLEQAVMALNKGISCPALLPNPGG